MLPDPKVTERDFFSPELFMEKLFGKSNLQPAGLRIRVGGSPDQDPTLKKIGNTGSGYDLKTTFNFSLSIFDDYKC